MHSRPTDLPDFTNPPLVEVVLGVQFSALPMKVIHAGPIHETFCDRYPFFEENAPLNHVFETFSSKVNPNSTSLKFDLLEKPDFPRLWLSSKEKSSLIQIQTDRFIQNWRKTDHEQDYPRYENILDEFSENFRAFSEKVSKLGLGKVEIDQSEITYVNFIEFTDHNFGDVSKYINMFREISLADGLKPERTSASFSMVAHKENTPYARLHVNTSPMISRFSNQVGQKFELTFRGAPEGEDIESAISLMNDGRSKIVNSFSTLTTASMHEMWGRKS